MQLSKAAAEVGAKISRNAEFLSLGLLSYHEPAMLVCLYDAAYLRRELLPNRQVAAVITTEELAAQVPAPLGVAVAGDPVSAFYGIHEWLLRGTKFYGEPFASEIDATARIHPDASIASENVRIGPRVRIEPRAVILPNTTIGADATIRAGAVVGAEGFEPKRISGQLRAIPHAGGVEIGARTEVQSNSVICRSVFGTRTKIGEESIISTLVNVSHNVVVGKRCRIASSAVLLGSSRVGDDVWIGPNATISNQVCVGDAAFVTLGAVVVRDVPAGARVSGNFAIDHRRFLAMFRSLLK